MGLSDILAQLKDVRGLIFDKAPDVLDRVADVLGQLKDAAKTASEWLRNLQGAANLFKGVDPKVREDFDKFLTETQAEAAMTPAKMAKDRKVKGQADMLPAQIMVDLLRSLASVTATIEHEMDEIPENEE